MKTISIISLKGGVAKTTTAINIAYVLAAVYQKKVLIVDNDKQGNTSKTFGLYNPDETNTIARVMTERSCDLNEIIQHTEFGVDVIPANMDLLEANLRTIIDTGRQQQTRFKKAFKQVQNEYDYCIIDNAPDINMSIINALVMTDDIIIPIMIDQYGFDGLNILMQQIADIKYDFNQNLNLKGCLITQYKKSDVQEQGTDILNSGYPVFKTKIRRTENKVNESTFAKMPVTYYSVRCGASQDYKRFVREYLGLD